MNSPDLEYKVILCSNTYSEQSHGVGHRSTEHVSYCTSDASCLGRAQTTSLSRSIESSQWRTSHLAHSPLKRHVENYASSLQEDHCFGSNQLLQLKMHRLYRRQTLCFLLLQSQIHAQQPQVLDDEDTPIVLAANNDTTFSTTNEPTFTTRIQNTGTAILLPSLDPDPHYRNPASQTTIPHASHLPRSEPITTLSDYIIGLTPGGTFTPEVVLVSGTPAAKPTPGAPGADSYTVKGNDREYLFKCRAPGPWKMCDGWPITSEICAKQCKCNSRLGMDEKGADCEFSSFLVWVV